MDIVYTIGGEGLRLRGRGGKATPLRGIQDLCVEVGKPRLLSQGEKRFSTYCSEAPESSERMAIIGCNMVAAIMIVKAAKPLLAARNALWLGSFSLFLAALPTISCIAP